MLSWLLTYADGTTWGPRPGIAESIAQAKPGAVLLTIVRGMEDLGSIALDAPKTCPIFYRMRAIEALGPTLRSEPFTVGAVFGRATPDGAECDLWTYRDGGFVGCPPELFAESGIRTCLGAA